MATHTRKKERLPPGFMRTEAGSLRVQIRITGHKPMVRTFPVFEQTVYARRRQLDEAQSWAVDIMTPFFSALLGLGINQGAYTSEVMRAGMLRNHVASRTEIDMEKSVGLTDGF